MRTKKEVNLREYKDFIEMIAKVEYQKLSSSHLIEYLELVNIASQALFHIFKDNPDGKFNSSYLTTAIKWAIRNEVRRRYKWYSLKNNQACYEPEDLREAVYKTIFSIDEMVDCDSTSSATIQIKDESKNPEELAEFLQLKNDIIEVVKKLPAKEKELIEKKFYKGKRLKEISAEMNISASRASRLIQSALNKIKQELVTNRPELL